MFYGSKLNEDSQDFINEVYKVLYVMVLASNEKDKIASDQLKDVSQTWYIIWRDNWTLRGNVVTCEVFRRSSLDCFFLRNKREDIVEEFINFHRVGMSVQQYSISTIVQVCSLLCI